MPESKSGALPLGDIPMFDRAHWGLYHEQDRFAIFFSGKPVQSRVLPSVFLVSGIIKNLGSVIRGFCVGITYLPGKSPCKYCRRERA